MRIEQRIVRASLAWLFRNALASMAAVAASPTCLSSLMTASRTIPPIDAIVDGDWA